MFVRMLFAVVMAVFTSWPANAEEFTCQVFAIKDDSITLRQSAKLIIKDKKLLSVTKYPKQILDIGKDCKVFDYVPDPEAIKANQWKDWLKGKEIPDGLRNAAVQKAMATASAKVGLSAYVKIDKDKKVTEVWIALPMPETGQRK